MQTDDAFAAREGRNRTLCVTNAFTLVSAISGCSHLERLLRERGLHPLSLWTTPGGFSAKASNTNKTSVHETD